jgi:hypothetical protein
MSLLGRPSPERATPGRGLLFDGALPSPPRSVVEIECGLVRPTVPPSLPPTPVPARPKTGHRVAAAARHRRARLEVLLVVRRAERAGE